MSASQVVSTGVTAKMRKFGIATTFVPTSFVYYAALYGYARTSWYAFVVVIPGSFASLVGFSKLAVVGYASGNFSSGSTACFGAKGPGRVFNAGAPSVVSVYDRSTSLQFVYSVSTYELTGLTSGGRKSVENLFVIRYSCSFCARREWPCFVWRR